MRLVSNSRSGVRKKHLPVRACLLGAISSITVGVPAIGQINANSNAVAPPSQHSGLQIKRGPTLERWRHAMAHTPLPGNGCFTTSYPDSQWHQVPCATKPPRLPTPPRIRSAGTDTGVMTVGNGTDYFAQVASGTTIYQGQGAFTQVLNVTSENEGGNANEFSLQLNSNAFTTNACNGLGGCIGWAQFLYTNPYYPLTGGSEPYGAAFIQYWLIPTNGQGLTCPSGPWQSSSGGCVYNSPVACVPSCDATTDLTIASLPLMTLTGTPGTAGNDEVVLSVGSTLYSVSNLISNPDMGLAGNWDTAEFNVFGDGGGSYATFNTGATVTVTISVNNGTTNAPSCAQTSPSGAATAETNSLTLVSPCCPISGASPGIAFLESSASPLPTEKCSASALGWLPAVLSILQYN